MSDTKIGTGAEAVPGQHIQVHYTGWLYDEAAGAPDHGIAPGTPWEQVPMNWTCPECGARKEDFEMVQI